MLFLCKTETASTRSLRKGEEDKGKSVLFTADVRKQITGQAAHCSVQVKA